MGRRLIALAVFLAMAACLAGCTAASRSPSGVVGSSSLEAPSRESGNSSAADFNATFPSWNSGAASLETLKAYVDASAKEGDPGYVPPEDRIAVFDMDGTLLCERAPVYANHMLLLHRVQADPNYTPSEELRALCDDIRASANEGVPLAGGGNGLTYNDAFAQAFAGMTPDELHAYVADFMATANVEGFTGMTYGESFYLPMIEMIGYLKANDFDVYVVTASEREVARAVVEPLGIDSAHVIGSDLSYQATNQGGQDGLDYTYAKDDELVLGGAYLEVTGKTNKVIAIQREIGKRPVLAFGNSSGDFAMLNYALDNGKYPSASFLVIADDVQREYGNADEAADMRNAAAEAGWTAVSMNDDWSTIYGDGVEKTHLPADAPQELPKAA